MKSPIVISNEDWNHLYMPQPREKKIGVREGVPEHKAAILPTGPKQKWTVSYKVYIEVIAPTYMEAVKLAEHVTGFDRTHLWVEMGEKQKDFPKLNGSHQSESNHRRVEPAPLSGPKIQRSTKSRKNKIRSRTHSKSR